MKAYPQSEIEENEDLCADCTRDSCTDCPNQSEFDRMLGIDALADFADDLPDLNNNIIDDDNEEVYNPAILDISPLPEPVPPETHHRTPKPRLADEPLTPKRGKGRPKKEVDPSLPKRKPGGQPGNLNAIRHGLYVQGNAIYNTNPIERARLFDLNRAIEYLKDYIDSAYQNGKKLKNTCEINDTLRALSLASMALTRLISSHKENQVSYLPHDLHCSRTTSLQKIENYYQKNAIFLDPDPEDSKTEGLNG